MRILMVGNAQQRRFGKLRVSTEYKLWNGLIRNNHNVLHYSDRDIAAFLAPFHLRDLGKRSSNRKLIQTANNFNPDLILLGHCDIIKDETLKEIRKLLPKVRIAYRNVDPLFVPKNVEAIHQRTNTVDSIFVTTAGKALDQFRGKRASIHYMPNPTDPVIETRDNSQCENLPIDLLFCGNSNEYSDRQKSIESLANSLKGDRIKFHAPGYFGLPNVWGRDYDNLIDQSKMGLNLNRQEGDYLYSSARLAQLMGNGILAFIHRAGNIQELIGEDSAVFFESDAELVKKVRDYNNDDAARREVASKGREFYRKYFSSDLIAQYIVDVTMESNHRSTQIWER
jgi:glycosyltransferase involved in cell wall biosynthesis